jgi:hypothetical protein
VAAIIVRNNPSLLFLSLGGPTGITTAEYLKSDSLVLWAQTRDSMGGGINSVKFYENGKLIATRIGFPYSYSRSLKNTALGSYTYYAVAVDSFGGTATSNVDTVRVVSAIPKITLLGPDTNSVLHPNDTFSVIAVVNGFSSISYVKFMIDSSRIIVDSTDPYSITLSGLTPGVHWINAIVRDGAGREYSSNYLYIYVQQSISYDPVVFITSPLDSSVFSSTSTILIKADASSPNDSVSQVQFYRDSVLLGIDFAAPFSYSWKRPTKGIYFLRAVARDTKGRTGSSNGVKVTVQ